MNNLSVFMRHCSVRVFAIFAIVLFALQAQAEDTQLNTIPAGQYQVDLAHASVVWKVNHLGFSTYVGRFESFTADLDLNSAEFAKSSVLVDIKVDSINTAYPFPEKEDFDKKLAGDWLKSGEHPSITFKSTAVSELDGNQATVDGELTIAGQTHPVSLNIVLNKAVASHPFTKVPTIGFSATTKIDRTVWGISQYAPALGAEVKIEIEGEFTHKAE